MRNIDKFFTTNKSPHIGDVWLVRYPYETRGNMEKPRPVIIVENNGEYLKVRKITTNEKRGKLIVHKKYFTRRNSYLTNDYATIHYTKLIRRIKSVHEKPNLQIKK